MCPIFMQLVKALMNLLMYILVETIKHLINFYSIKQIGVIYLCVCVVIALFSGSSTECHWSLVLCDVWLRWVIMECVVWIQFYYLPRTNHCWYGYEYLGSILRMVAGCIWLSRTCQIRCFIESYAVMRCCILLRSSVRFFVTSRLWLQYGRNVVK